MNMFFGIVLELIDGCRRLRDIEGLFLVKVGKQSGDQVVLLEQLTAAFPFPIGLLNGGGPFVHFRRGRLRTFNGLHTTCRQCCQAINVLIDIFVQLGSFWRYNVVQGTFGSFG